MLKRIILIISAVLILLSANAFAIDTYYGCNIPIDIDINGNIIICAEKPIMINGSTYIPLRAFSDAIGGTIGWDSYENAATMTKNGHTFVFSPGRYCMVDGVSKNYSSINYKNLVFIPVRAVSETLNYGVEWDDFNLAVKITASGVVVSDACRDYTYTYEDVLYLSKIVQIESGYQPFYTKLGVANTVINRVKSGQFPNNIKDVIFDTKYGVQFPPAHTDKFNAIPTKESVIAAKCALNGVNNVRNSLYFISVNAAPTSWAHKNRPYYLTINDMSFYE